MCHRNDSHPPASARAGVVGEAADLPLTSADGARLMAYLAFPERLTAKAAVVLPDIRGLHGFYRSFARRLAEAGIAAVAIDYYGRVLPDGPRDAPLEEMFPLVRGLAPEQVAADAGAAAGLLRSRGAEAVFAVGFCFGGSKAWTQSAFDDRLAGCAGFYGRPEDCRPFLADLRGPMLLLVAGADALTPVADFRAFDAELSAAGVGHEMIVYDGAPHGFFDATTGHEDACADAWRRLLNFMDVTP